MDLDATEEAEVGQSMYMFEGTDYSKEPSTADVQAFEDLIQGNVMVWVKGPQIINC